MRKMFPFFNFLYKKKEKSNRLNETAKMNFFVVLVGIVSNIITQSKEIIIQRVTSQREGHVLHTRQQCVYRETSSKTSSIFLFKINPQRCKFNFNFIGVKYYFNRKNWSNIGHFHLQKRTKQKKITKKSFR